jgi:hypothetical protein
MSSNAAFKESSKIQLLRQCIMEAGWHFQSEKPIAQDFLEHLNHPYKGKLLPLFMDHRIWLNDYCRRERGHR